MRHGAWMKILGLMGVTLVALAAGSRSSAAAQHQRLYWCPDPIPGFSNERLNLRPPALGYPVDQLVDRLDSALGATIRAVRCVYGTVDVTVFWVSKGTKPSSAFDRTCRPVPAGANLMVSRSHQVEVLWNGSGPARPVAAGLLARAEPDAYQCPGAAPEQITVCRLWEVWLTQGNTLCRGFWERAERTTSFSYVARWECDGRTIPERSVTPIDGPSMSFVTELSNERFLYRSRSFNNPYPGFMQGTWERQPRTPGGYMGTTEGGTFDAWCRDYR